MYTIFCFAEKYLTLGPAMISQNIGFVKGEHKLFAFRHIVTDRNIRLSPLNGADDSLL